MLVREKEEERGRLRQIVVLVREKEERGRGECGRLRQIVV